MSEIIDARGLSCPQPVLIFFEAIKKKKNFTILVDAEVAKLNVLRAAKSKNLEIKNIIETNSEYQINCIF